MMARPGPPGSSASFHFGFWFGFRSIFQTARVRTGCTMAFVSIAQRKARVRSGVTWRQFSHRYIHLSDAARGVRVLTSSPAVVGGGSEVRGVEEGGRGANSIDQGAAAFKRS